MPWDFALLILMLGVVAPWRSVVRMRQLTRRSATTSPQRLVLYATTMAGQWLVAGVALWRALARGIPARSLGLALDNPGRTLAATAVLCVAFASAQIYGLRRLARLPVERQPSAAVLARKLMPQNSVESLAFVAVACTAGVCEEFIYRGFLLTALARAAGDVPGAMIFGVVLSTLLFAMAHLYQGARGVLSTFMLGLWFCALRFMTGSLVPGAAVHFGIDLVFGLAAPRLLAREKQQPSPAIVDAGAPFLGERIGKP
jgi:membrane protease YdiL (CAAX protease family)